MNARFEKKGAAVSRPALNCRLGHGSAFFLSIAVCMVIWVADLRAGTIFYTHDPAGRLTAVNYGGGKSIGYTYDLAGNLTARQFLIGSGGDSDNDGMDDAWELQYFTNLSSDGTGDFDGDGASDLAEFLAGTIPNDPNSVFEILPNPVINGSGATVQWQSVSGKTYQLQFKNSLSDTDWQNVPGNVTAAGSTAFKLDSTATGQAVRFYRVLLVQ